MFGRMKSGSRLLDVDRIRRAIEDAERRTSGEICVAVSPFFWGNVYRAAERAFARLGMNRTRGRNGVLLFIVPSRRAFVVLGDEGIHEHAGDALWSRVIEEMSPLFRRGDFTAGVLHGIAVVAAELERQFPADGAAGQNELPDVV